MSRKQKQLVRVLCIAFAALLLISGAWVTVHRQHDCPGVHCQVCAAISSWEQLLRTMAVAALAMGLLRAILLSLVALRSAHEETAAPLSLVALRVKLSN